MGRGHKLTLPTSLAAVCVVTAVGCGDGDGGKTSAQKTSSGAQKTSSGAKAPKRAVPGLARPIYPQCAFPSFQKAKATQTNGPGGGGAWQLSYLYPGLVAANPGTTTNVLIIEESPKLPRSSVKGGSGVVVAGRSVDLRRPSNKSSVFLAGWKTKRARYLMLANGDRTATLKRFIACLP